jgi:hypothetical protein
MIYASAPSYRGDMHVQNARYRPIKHLTPMYLVAYMTNVKVFVRDSDTSRWSTRASSMHG